MKMKKYLSVLLAVLLLTGLGLFGAVHAEAANAVNYTPPANLDKLSQAEQLVYFNLVVNRVRTEQPGFQQKTLLAIDSIELPTSANIVSGIVYYIKNNLMPSEWKTQTIVAGKHNKDWFFSKNANASNLRPEDITSISCAKEGGNWVIELGIVEETNPNPGLASAHSRIAPIATREQVVDKIAGVTNDIKVEMEDVTLRYHSGFVRVTVNSQGQVIAGSNGFQVQAQANNVKIAILQVGVSAEQSSEWQYTNFNWTKQSCLAKIWNFILKWVLFGWLWMR